MILKIEFVSNMKAKRIYAEGVVTSDAEIYVYEHFYGIDESDPAFVNVNIFRVRVEREWVDGEWFGTHKDYVTRITHYHTALYPHLKTVRKGQRIIMEGQLAVYSNMHEKNSESHFHYFSIKRAIILP